MVGPRPVVSAPVTTLPTTTKPVPKTTTTAPAQTTVPQTTVPHYDSTDINDVTEAARRLGHPPGGRHAMWPGGLLGRFELGRSGELRQHPGRIRLGTTRRVTGAAVSAVVRQHRDQGVDDVAAVRAIGR